VQGGALGIRRRGGGNPVAGAEQGGDVAVGGEDDAARGMLA
jgi:hypothetical protein